jgi:hypothetical protein
MATIVLKESFLLEGEQGMQVSVIKCDVWQKSPFIDGIEVMVERKRVTIPTHNITAIIEW